MAHQIGKFNNGKQDGVEVFPKTKIKKNWKIDNGKLIGQWKWHHTNGKIYSEKIIH
jgi:antitoxin component YwqK of YwqJK toxin-antitoxin module